MLYRIIRNRLKIPNRVAALAALLIVITSIADPRQLKLMDIPEPLVQQESFLSDDETVTELADVPVTAIKPINLNISTLIFRF